MSDKKHSLGRNLFGGLFSLVVVGIAAFIFLNQQYIKDQVAVWSYTPTVAIQALEKDVDFTDKGKFTFYAQRPEIDGSDAFNKNCQRQEVGNPILGCYLGNKIYVFNVTNAQLDGMKEVTAAHETLHAVWDRMNDNDRAHISSLLEAEYGQLGANTDLVQRMDYYKRAEPGQFDNELHSILGTELPNLSPELEVHYKQYFVDRQKVVSYHAKYAALFTDLKAKSDALYAELTALSANIDARSTQYDADVKQLSADISSFNTRADKGAFSSLAQFNSQRAALLVRSNQLDAERASISADIDMYNAKVAEYQKLSSEIEALNTSIDSIKALQPTPSI